MRADRLVATLLLLQARGRLTTAELARELEVSPATARRDLEALSIAGIPVYAQAGRGGGWSLLGGARTDLSGLSAPEAQALFVLVGPAARLAPEARSALRKLVRALPETFRADAQAAARAVVLDPSTWGALRSVRPALVHLFQAAIVGRRRVRLVYRGRGRDSTERLVDPLGLADKGGTWYLVARTVDGQRTFRIDRVIEAKPTDLVFEPPAEFDLPTAWARVVDEMEARRGALTSTVLIGKEHLAVLRKQFGRQCDVDGPIEDGRIRVRLSAPTPLMIAQHLAGWGALVEVVEPQSLKDELARLGSELLDRYGVAVTRG